MPWTLAPIVLALATATASSSTALASGSGTPLRITYVEGTVGNSADGLWSRDGRAEAMFPDGSVLHVDSMTRVAFVDRHRIRLIDGRVFVRTSATSAIDVDLSLAVVRLAPRGAYSILIDAARETLLVSVAVGHADIEGRFGSTQVVGRQMAMMTGPTSRPYATPFETARWDSFEQWSDQRMTMLAYGADSTWTPSQVTQSGLVVDRPKDSSLTCSSWLSFDNPCWVVGVIPPPFVPFPPPPNPTPYAPNYAPNYAPAFGVGPMPDPRGHGRPAPAPPPAAAPPAPDVRPLPRIIPPPPPPPPPATPPATPKATTGTVASRPPK